VQGPLRSGLASKPAGTSPIVAMVGVSDRTAARLILEASDSDLTFIRCESIAGLRRILASATECAVLVELANQPPPEIASTISGLRAALPPVEVVGLVSAWDIAHRRIICAAVASGVSSLASFGDPELYSALRAAADRCVTAREISALESRVRSAVHPEVWPLIEKCIRTSNAGRSISELAESLGVSRATLVRRSQRVDLPPPKTLARWTQALVASAFLKNTRWTVQQSARAAGLMSSLSLRRVLGRLTGQRPNELRSEYGREVLFAAFVRAVSDRDQATPRFVEASAAVVGTARGKP
jgi:AraC-like DNA-binding protein